LAEHVASIGQTWDAWKPRVKHSVRGQRRLDNNIKTDLREWGCEDVSCWEWLGICCDLKEWGCEDVSC
jgi:hypothetical protein